MNENVPFIWDTDTTIKEFDKQTIFLKNDFSKLPLSFAPRSGSVLLTPHIKSSKNIVKDMTRMDIFNSS